MTRTERARVQAQAHKKLRDIARGAGYRVERDAPRRYYVFRGDVWLSEHTSVADAWILVRQKIERALAARGATIDD